MLFAKLSLAPQRGILLPLVLFYPAFDSIHPNSFASFSSEVPGQALYHINHPRPSAATFVASFHAPVSESRAGGDAPTGGHVRNGNGSGELCGKTGCDSRLQ